MLALAAAAVLVSAIAAAPASGTEAEEPFSLLLRSDLYTHRFVADTDDATALFVNPAGLAFRRNANSIVRGTYLFDRLAEFTAALSVPNFGLGYMRQDTGYFKSNSYVMGIAAKLGRGLSVGTSLQWHHTDLPAENRSPFAVDAGFTMRPHRYLSIGGVWQNANRPRLAGGAIPSLSGGHTGGWIGGRLEDTFTGGVSIRPLTERITLSGQGTFSEETGPGWLFGGRIEVVPGLELFGSYMRDHAAGGAEPYEEYTGGIALSFETIRAITSTRSRAGGDYDYSRNTFALERTGSFRKHVLVRRKKYAEVRVSGNYLDEGGGFVLMGGRSKDLHGLLRELESIRGDGDVRGLLLQVGPIEGAFIGPVTGNLYEIREAVMAVREAGKPVVAYLSEMGGPGELYLASAADRIVIPQESIVGLIGVSLEINRLKRLFEKLGIDWDFYTAGDYKSSFHTPYTDTTTAAQAIEIQSLVDESYRIVVETIAEGRGIDTKRMYGIADGRIMTTNEALQAGLVDLIGWEKTAREELGRLAGLSRPDRLRTTSIAKRRYWRERWTPAPAVAVVGAYGGIESGKSGRDVFRGGRTMGSTTVVRQLEAAASHPGVRAIVFRVDSGGGSALASDEILKEIRRIQDEERIPVIVSMGNIAGSGGYWISMYGDAVFADPFTITGSIGAAFAKPVLARLYEKIGVTNEVFKKGEHSDAFSSSRRMTDEEFGFIDALITETYERFLDNVSKGRGIDPEKLRSLAGGRVYLGTQALGHGLIDRLGGLNDAVAYAAGQAGIAGDYRTVYFRAFPGFMHGYNLEGVSLGIGRAVRSLWPLKHSAFDETLTVF